MNLALLTLIGTAWPRPTPSEPGAGSSTRAAPVLYPTLADMGMAPPPELTPNDVGLTPEEQAHMERELLPGPPNRKQRRAAARRMR